MKGNNYEERYADMDIDELEMELEDLNNAIENEKSWLTLASRTIEFKKVISENVKKLQNEAAYVRKLIKELMYE